jgi:hypothetical protein
VREGSPLQSTTGVQTYDEVQIYLQIIRSSTLNHNHRLRPRHWHQFVEIRRDARKQLELRFQHWRHWHHTNVKRAIFQALVISVHMLDFDANVFQSFEFLYFFMVSFLHSVAQVSTAT